VTVAAAGSGLEGTAMSEGVCWLIGAGPGSAELLTLLGKRRLREADAVLYDSLVDPRALEWARPEAELIAVGKRSGAPSMTQAEINSLLCERVAGGQRVARLKGGDPFIFGRGGEEADALAARRLAYEVVPGVTAASAASAYAGIPLTHRGVASSVTLVAGREAPDSVAGAGPDWKSLAAGGGTLCISMGAERAAPLAETLLRGGRTPDEPVAVVARAGYPDQAALRLSLGELATMEDGALERPALILVGKTAALHETLGWLEKKPLHGKTVVIARSDPGRLGATLAASGARIIPMPVFQIRDAEFKRGGPERDSLSAALLDCAAFGSPDRPEWAVFTSGNAVRAVWRRIRRLGGDVRWFGGMRIAAVGGGTADALSEIHIVADMVAVRQDAAGLAEALGKRLGGSLSGTRFLHFAGDLSSGETLALLVGSGAVCRSATAYHTVGAESVDAEARFRIENGGADVIALLSGSAAEHLCRLFSTSLADWRAGKGPAIACMGKTSVKALANSRLQPRITSYKPKVDAFSDAITRFLSEKRP
jgi:uroporphyrinogen III methyltransferase/synthase